MSDFELTEERLEYVHPTGWTFHAVAFDLGSSWARALDPMTAIRNAGGWSKTVAVACAYGKFGDLESTQWGNFTWNQWEPIPVGLFLVTPRTIKPMPSKTKEFGKHQDCDEWIAEFFDAIKRWKDDPDISEKYWHPCPSDPKACKA